MEPGGQTIPHPTSIGSAQKPGQGTSPFLKHTAPPDIRIIGSHNVRYGKTADTILANHFHMTSGDTKTQRDCRVCLRAHWELGCKTCPGALWIIGGFKASGILATHPFSMLFLSEYLGSPIFTLSSKVPEIQVLKWTGVKILIHFFFPQGTFDLNPLCPRRKGRGGNWSGV